MAPLRRFCMALALRILCCRWSLVVTTGTIQAGGWFLFLLQSQSGPLKISHRKLRVLAMALQAPAHSQRRHLADRFHGFHWTVTSLAGNAGNHVLAVIEINKVRKVMHLHPADWPLLLDGLFEFFNLDRLLFQDGMAIHADAGRRNAGVP